MSKTQGILSLIGACGCLIFALFIFFGFFGSPVEVRIPALGAAVITFGCLVGSAVGGYCAYKTLIR